MAGLSSVPTTSQHRRVGPDAQPAFGDGVAVGIPRGDAAWGALLPLTLQAQRGARGEGLDAPCHASTLRTPVLEGDLLQVQLSTDSSSCT